MDATLSEERSRFEREVRRLWPRVDQRTMEALWGSGIHTLEQLAKMREEELKALGLRRPARRALLLGARASQRLFRYRKGFDSFWDPNDLYWIVPIMISALTVIAFGLTGCASCLWWYDLLLVIWLWFLAGLYFVFVVADREKTSLVSDFLDIVIWMWIARFWAPFILFRWLKSGLETVSFFTFGIVALIVTAHDLLFKYQTPYVVRMKSIDWMSSFLYVIPFIYGAIVVKIIVVHLVCGNALSYLEILALIFTLWALWWLHGLGNKVSERRETPSPQSAAVIYLLFFVLIIMNVFLWDQSRPLILVMDEILLRTLVPAGLLYLYILFPTRFFPKLGLVFVTYLFLWAIISVFSTIPALTLLVPRLSEGFWEGLGKASDIVGILGFLGFSLSGAYRLFVSRSLEGEKKVHQATIGEVVEDLITWGTGFIAPYLPFWEASNVCFEMGYLEKGIQVCKDALENVKLPRYHQAAMKYQIACGYALKGEKERALRSLREAVALWPSFRKKALQDEMLASIREEIAIKFPEL